MQDLHKAAAGGWGGGRAGCFAWAGECSQPSHQLRCNGFGLKAGWLVGWLSKTVKQGVIGTNREHIKNNQPTSLHPYFLVLDWDLKAGCATSLQPANQPSRQLSGGAVADCPTRPGFHLSVALGSKRLGSLSKARSINAVALLGAQPGQQLL